MNELNTNLSNTIEDPEYTGKAPKTNPADNIVDIDIDRINKIMISSEREVEAIAISLEEFGFFLEPLIVRPSGNGYEILVGHDYAAAAKKLGLSKVPCVVLYLNDEQAFKFICDYYDCLRKPLPSEIATSIHAIYEILKKRGGKGRTVDRVAKRTGFSPAKVQRCLRLYDLGDRFMDAVDSDFVKETSAVDKVYPMTISTRDLILARISSHGTVFSDKCLGEILFFDRLGKITPELFMQIVTQYEKKRKK